MAQGPRIPLLFVWVVVIVPAVLLLKFTAPPVFRTMRPNANVFPVEALMVEAPALTVSPATAWLLPLPPFSAGA